MPPLSDLELLIESKYPLIAVETEEEDRLDDLRQSCAPHVAPRWPGPRR